MSEDKNKNLGRYPALQSWVDDFWGTTKMFGEQIWNRTNLPAVNIKESRDNFSVEVAAPGMRKSDFTVNVDEGILNIHAERKEEEIKKEENFTLREFSSTSFTRSFNLPVNVKEDGIKAEYNEGVLKILLKKEVLESSRKKTVKIS